MAMKYANWTWEGLSTEPKPASPEAEDGHLFKELDTGDMYTRVSGAWQLVPIQFIKATKSGRIVTDAGGQYHVTFVTPFIDDDYTVALATQDAGAVKPAMAFWDNIAADGFDIMTRDSKQGEPFGAITVSWLATRNYDP